MKVTRANQLVPILSYIKVTALERSPCLFGSAAATAVEIAQMVLLSGAKKGFGCENSEHKESG